MTRAMRAVADSNEELRGVFTVDWNQPAPDGSGKPLIPNEVVHALVQHFDAHNLSNANVPSDILGKAYEYLIKHFADDAGAKAGEFFTPPEVVDTLVRMLEPRPGDTIYDPTSGSGGMLVHCADYLRETGHHATSARYFGQEMNWGNAAISKINSVLHGLDADIAAGASTITDPQFLDEPAVCANSPLRSLISLSLMICWWLRPEQQTDDKKKKEKLKKETFGKEGYKDPHARFGRGAAYPSPPAGYGDYAFILHILASLAPDGRAGIVCPQGVLFRGQPQIDPNEDDLSSRRKRKADSEYLIRRALLDAHLVDAVISLPLNVFYGATVPACLLLLRRNRPQIRQDKVLLIYAARDYRELSAQNELRPQDVMRILVHYYTYGDTAKLPGILQQQVLRIDDQIYQREADNIALLQAEYEECDANLREVAQQLRAAQSNTEAALSTAQRRRAVALLTSTNRQQAATLAQLAERDERIAEVQRRAQEDRDDVKRVAQELSTAYADEDELVKYARVVSLSEIEENEYSLNLPRYIDTFEPADCVPVPEAMSVLAEASGRLREAQESLSTLMGDFGYAGE